MATNRHGVDVNYFKKTVDREMAEIKDQTPSDLARVFARLSRTSDDSVLLEPEFAKKHIDRIEALEQENERLKDFILESSCPQSWEEGSRLTYPNCGKCVYCEIMQALHKEGES